MTKGKTNGRVGQVTDRYDFVLKARNLAADYERLAPLAKDFR